MHESSPAEPLSDAIAAFLGGVELGAPDALDGLTLWPLLRRAHAKPASATAPPFELLADALARGSVVIDEISDAGSVPNVRVRNAGDLAVLVLFGEELRGAKQNRIANASFLVPPQREVVIDVSCVEAGRWQRARRGGFHTSGSLVSHKLRAKMARAVSASRAQGGGFTPDQGEVWDEVGKRLERSGVHSPTSAYAEYFAAREAGLERVRTAAPRPAPRQVGFVAGIGGRIAGLEALGDERAFAASYPRLLDAHAIDALDPEEDGAPPVFDPAEFLRGVAHAARTTSPSLGLGVDVRLESAATLGCALVAGSLVHLMAAPQPA